MKSKVSKSERKEDKIQQLEQELSETKKKIKTQSKVVKLDDEQIDAFLEQLTERIEWSTNKIVDESFKSSNFIPIEHYSEGGFTYFIKLIIATPFFIVAVALIYSIYHNCVAYWNLDLVHKLVLIIMGILVVDSAGLGVEILKEKDRNYIISLFSALVALVALIVSLVK